MTANVIFLSQIVYHFLIDIPTCLWYNVSIKSKEEPKMMNYLITGTVNRYTALDEYLTTTALDSSIETLIAAQRRMVLVYKLTDDNCDLEKLFKVYKDLPIYQY